MQQQTEQLCNLPPGLMQEHMYDTALVHPRLQHRKGGLPPRRRAATLLQSKCFVQIPKTARTAVSADSQSKPSVPAVSAHGCGNCCYTCCCRQQDCYLLSYC
jgi:hypothetical protein